MSNQAATLQCPTCGAPALSDATYCAYCKARLATVACPSCFGMVFAGTKFCPHCGAHADRAAATAGESEAPRKCPRCRVELTAVGIGGVPVRECPDCSGLWLSADTFQRVSTEREAQSAVLVGAGGTGEPARAAPEAQIHYVPCPECGKVMNRVNFARVSGVVVDVCKGHGTWFDADELRRVVEFIRGGGLEVAREKERQALEEERRRLLATQQQGGAQGFAAGTLHVGMGASAWADAPGGHHSGGLLGALVDALRDSFRLT
jgi:Zn-finger nucleic acid-binding protein